jgi:hypothetical protein
MRPIPEWWSIMISPAAGSEETRRQLRSSRGMNGCWSASRSAALVRSATRDWFRGFVIGHHDGLDGVARVRGGFGAEFRAIIGRYSKGMVRGLRGSRYLRCVDTSTGIGAVLQLASIIHSRQRPRGKPFREKAMGLCLDVDCEPLIWSKQQWKQVTARPSTLQVKATTRPGAFSLQASPHGLRLLSLYLAP